MDFGQLALNALVLGASYALVALGFVLVLNATTAVNFAHGDLVMAGGMLAVALAAVVPLGGIVPGLVLLPIVLLAMAAAGLLFSLLAYSRCGAGRRSRSSFRPLPSGSCCNMASRRQWARLSASRR